MLARRLSFLLYFSLFSVCYAQSFFNNNTGANTTPNHILSPDEYKNMVNTLGKQNQDDLTNTVKQQLATQPKSVAPSVPSPPPVTNQTSTETSVTETPPPQPVTTTPPPPVAPVTTEQPSATPTPSYPTTTTTPPAAPQKTPENQPYTGFVNPNNNTTNQNTNSSSDQSSGWKVQY